VKFIVEVALRLFLHALLCVYSLIVGSAWLHQRQMLASDSDCCISGCYRWPSGDDQSLSHHEL